MDRVGKGCWSLLSLAIMYDDVDIVQSHCVTHYFHCHVIIVGEGSGAAQLTSKLHLHLMW